MVNKENTTGKKKKEGIVIKRLGKSTLVEEDLQKAEKNLEYSEPKELKEDKTPKLFYRNFVFRCEKCIHEFKHETTVPILEHKVVCPKCNETHVLRVVPVARHYELKMPKSLKAIKHHTEK